MKLVLIEWVDSTSMGGWTDNDDMDLCECETVGFLLKEDKKKVIVAQSISDGATRYCDRFGIPRGCIKSIRKLK